MSLQDFTKIWIYEKEGKYSFELPCLYLYVTIEQLRGILRNQALKLSRPKRTNDATENVTSGVDPRVATRIKQHGYLCFSSTNNSPMMWGQYAGRGSGACLTFAVPLIPQPSSGHYSVGLLKEGKMWESPTPSMHMYQVNYGTPPANADEFLRLMTTKSADWSYEKEYRIVLPLSNATSSKEEGEFSLSREYLFQPIMRSLVQVVLGPNCEIEEVDAEMSINEHLKKITDIPVKVLRAQINPADLSITVPSIDIIV